MSPWQEITINGQLWTLGRSLGSGGFGEVYSAESRGQRAAIKLVPKDPGARRELLFADDLRGATNVLPVQGIGETDDSWALLMPLAEQTLRQHLSEAGGPLNEDEALPILIDLAQALTSLAATGVVHRDLKPENVLLHQGSWCLTDFGISRYAEAATEEDTRKYSTTRPYAAPEQWRDETATALTDVYALGVIGHELLMGSRPFPGPEFRHQHLHRDPPVIRSAAPALAALIEACLFKASGARPAAEDLYNSLDRLAKRTSAAVGLEALQKTNLWATTESAQEARRQSEARSEKERIAMLLRAAESQFAQISSELKQAILVAAPRSKVRDNKTSGWELTLGAAMIRLSWIDLAPRTRPENGQVQVAGGWQDWTDPTALPFDVIIFADITISSLPYPAMRMSHSLWFCDAAEAGNYGWYEVAFAVTDNKNATQMTSVGHQPARAGQPFFSCSVRPDNHMAAIALGASPNFCTVVWPFTRLRVGQLDEFINRWGSRLATAAQGKIQPLIVPPGGQTQNSWRNKNDQIFQPAPTSANAFAIDADPDFTEALADYRGRLAEEWSGSNEIALVVIENPENSELMEAIRREYSLRKMLYITREGPLRLKRIRPNRSPSTAFLERAVWVSPTRPDGGQIVLDEEYRRMRRGFIGVEPTAELVKARLLDFRGDERNRSGAVKGAAFENGRASRRLQDYLSLPDMGMDRPPISGGYMLPEWGDMPPLRPGFIPTDPEPTVEQRYALPGGGEQREMDQARAEMALDEYRYPSPQD